jgi:hypothetical protein
LQESPMKYISVVQVILLLIPWYFLSSQELNCTVTVNTESINSAQRDYLRTFESDVQNYLNSTRFTDEDLDGEKIDCSFTVIFKSAMSNNRYQAQVVITSQRPIYIVNDKSDRNTPVLRISDVNWQFSYLPNQQIIHNEMDFDAFTSFLDFYAYLIIGYDLETYEPMSGSNSFQKALKVVQFATNSSVSNDWQVPSAAYSKFGIIDELTNVKYNQFRIAFNSYFFDGIDMLTTDQQNALSNILKALKSIDGVRHQNQTSIVIKQFYDAKFREIAEIFQNYNDRSVYDNLSVYDQEHRATYQEWMTKK